MDYFVVGIIESLTPMVAQAVAFGIGLGGIAWGLGYVVWVAIDLMRGGV